jgi:hypothetical protein
MGRWAVGWARRGCDERVGGGLAERIGSDLIRGILFGLEEGNAGVELSVKLFAGVAERILDLKEGGTFLVGDVRGIGGRGRASRLAEGVWRGCATGPWGRRGGFVIRGAPVGGASLAIPGGNVGD